MLGECARLLTLSFSCFSSILRLAGKKAEVWIRSPDSVCVCVAAQEHVLSAPRAARGDTWVLAICCHSSVSLSLDTELIY